MPKQGRAAWESGSCAADLTDVTVGIPTYNRAATLGASVESVIAQRYVPLNIVIADNASTDTTVEVCKSFLDGNVSCFSHAANIGAAANFESLLMRARSCYFMWLADDDWLDPTYISDCIECLEKNPDVVLAYGRARYYRGDKFVFDGTDGDLQHDLPLFRLISYFWRVKDNAMFYGVYRREALNDVGFGRGFAADWLLVAQVVARGKVRQVASATIHRRLGGASASTKQLAISSETGVFASRFPFVAAAVRLAGLLLQAPAFKRELGTLSRLVAIPALFLTLLVRGGLDEVGHQLHRAALRYPSAAAFIKKSILRKK